MYFTTTIEKEIDAIEEEIKTIETQMDEIEASNTELKIKKRNLRALKSEYHELILVAIEFDGSDSNEYKEYNDLYKKTQEEWLDIRNEIDFNNLLVRELRSKKLELKSEAEEKLEKYKNMDRTYVLESNGDYNEYQLKAIDRDYRNLCHDAFDYYLEPHSDITQSSIDWVQANYPTMLLMETILLNNGVINTPNSTLSHVRDKADEILNSVIDVAAEAVIDVVATEVVTELPALPAETTITTWHKVIAWGKEKIIEFLTNLGIAFNKSMKYLSLCSLVYHNL